MGTNGSPSAADAVANGGGVSSPQSRRRSLHSPWASVVRGDSEHNASPTAAAPSEGGSPGLSTSPAEEEASAPDNTLIENSGSDPQPESTENNGDSNAGGPRRPAWNRPQNGAVDPASVIGGSTSWPALSETTRPVQRSLSDTSRPVSDGSTPSLQAPIISQPPQRSATSGSGHGNSAGNNPNPARPRSRNRGGGGGGGVGLSGTGPSPPNQPSPPMPPPFPFIDLPYAMPAGLDHSVRGSRPLTGNDHSSQRSNSRRGNYSPRPRGDGQYHNHHVGRREQDRRDVHQAPPFVPPPPPPMGFIPPPLTPGVSPYMGPLPMRVFPGQIGFVSDMPPSFVYMSALPQAIPVVTPPPPPVILPSANESPSLTSSIVKQIDFYFSDDNLAKDGFLKSKMDEHGWVPISLIASFRRVHFLTNDIPLILESLRHSVVVEVHGDKVRRRNEWSKWLLSTSMVNSDSATGASSSAAPNVLDAMTHLNGNVDAMEGHVEMETGESSESTSQSGLANGDNAEGRSRNL